MIDKDESKEPDEGFDRIAKLFGRNTPRPKLKVVTEGQRAPRTTQGVNRPVDPENIVGQDMVKIQVEMTVMASLKRGETPGSILLMGPPGLGKTTIGGGMVGWLAQKNRDDTGDPQNLGDVTIHIEMGTSVDNTQRLATALCKIKRGDILFIDEIHQMGLKSEEMLGLAMEDGRIIIPGNKGEETEIREIPPFTLVGATTMPSKLSRPLKDRFQTECNMDWYEVDELALIVRNAAAKVGWELSDEIGTAIGTVAWGTPRRALKAWQNARDYAEVADLPEITEGILKGALKVMGLDTVGMSAADRKYLITLHDMGHGKRIGVISAAAVAGLEQREIERDIEPRLIRYGFLDKGSRGRCLSLKAYGHLYPDMQPPIMRGHV